MRRQSSSEAAWSLLTSAVSEARVEAHRLRHLVNRGLAIIEKDTPEQKEHLYRVAGDLIEAGPKRLDNLERLLDKTSFALSKMGEEFFSSRLSIDDKTEVNESIEHSAHPFSQTTKDSARNVASAYLRMADLNPPLGRPGGPCGVVKRIDQNVNLQSLKDSLIDEVESGGDLSLPETAKVYPLDAEIGGGMWKRMFITSHAQYRMVLRGVSVGGLQKSLSDLTTEMTRDRTLMAEVVSGKYRWEDRKRGMVVVLESQGRDAVTIVTVFFTSAANPKPPVGGCKL